MNLQQILFGRGLTMSEIFDTINNTYIMKYVDKLNTKLYSEIQGNTYVFCKSKTQP